MHRAFNPATSRQVRQRQQSGYHGYAWRHALSTANLDIWCHRDPPETDSCLDIETIEAEVVYLIRQAGQWPRFQTEIHFHPSGDEHRQWALTIAETYDLTQQGSHLLMSPTDVVTG